MPIINGFDQQFLIAVYATLSIATTPFYISARLEIIVKAEVTKL